MNSENKELYKKYEKQYNILRPLNNDLISYNFHNSQNPYSPHAVYDSKWELFYILDNTVSIIDAKTARITEDVKNMKFVIKDVTKAFDTAKTLQFINRSLIENLNIWNNTSISLVKPFVGTFEAKDKLKNKNILKKLYNDTIRYKDDFWDKRENNTIIMNQKWRMYFSDILSDFYRYNESNNFLSKNRKENLFPNNIYLAIREKLKNKSVLTTDEICQFVWYLLTKSQKNENETEQEKVKRHHANTAKSHLINILYAMMYSEQKYSCNTMSEINEWLFDMSQVDKKLWEELNITWEDIYTEIRPKWLASLAFKETRGEFATDRIGSRTRFDDNLLVDQEKKYTIIESSFNNSINHLIEFYRSKWWELICDSFEVANKFKKWEITFDNNIVNEIASNIKNRIFDKQKSYKNEKNINVRDVYDYDILNISNVTITDEEKKIIQTVLDNDNSKTWGNGAYADIKFRMMFHLVNTKNPTDIIYNQSYEHMIVNMDSMNEWGLSEHNIFLDPIKNIAQILRISTALDLDIFVDSICGGIDKTIKELAILKSYIDDPLSKPQNMSMKYIEKQYGQRKFIPKEILDIAWLTAPYMYLDLDTNAKDKEKIENAVAEYLLIDQFKKWKLHRFVYDNDNIEGLTDQLEKNLHRGKDISYKYSWHKDLLKKGLQEKHTGKYCVCGGWSNNIAKWSNSKLFSDKSSIWIVNDSDDSITFFTTPVFTGIVAEWTHIKKPGVILWDIKSIYRAQLKKLPKESSN